MIPQNHPLESLKTLNKEYRPWGLYDHLRLPPPAEEAVSAALNELKISAEARSSVREDIQEIVELYWRLKRSVEKPEPQFYRLKNKSVRAAATRLLSHLRVERGKEKELRALGSLPFWFERTRGRRLLGRGKACPEESLVEQLEALVVACDRALPDKSAAGSKRQTHIERTAGQVVELWRKHTGKLVPMSFDASPDPKWKFGLDQKAFSQPALRFVQLVLQGIDPSISVAQITTALRRNRM